MIEFLQLEGTAPSGGRGWVERAKGGGGVHRPIRRPPPNVLGLKDDDEPTGSSRPRNAARRLRDLTVHFISLVPAAANARTVLVKSAARSGRVVLEKEVGIIKADALRQMVYGIVYAPDEVDTEGDTVDAAEIERAAHGFMREGRTGQIDSDHDGKAGKGYVAESWIVRDGDPLFPDETPGAWAVGIKVTDAATWARVARQELRGISLAGLARPDDVERDIPEADAFGEMESASGLLTRLRKMLGLDGADEWPRRSATRDRVDEIARVVTRREDVFLDLASQTERLAERLEAVERQTAGRQTLLGGTAPVRKGKGYRGVGIV